MKRKFLAALLALVMVFSMIPVSASAAEQSVTSKDGSFSVSYQTGTAKTDVTFTLYKPDGTELSQMVIHDPRALTHQFTLSLLGDVKDTYDIGSLEIDREIGTTQTISQDTCTFEMGYVDRIPGSDNYKGSVKVYLVPQFEEPQIVDGEYDTAGIIRYQAYQQDLLKLLYTNDVLNIDENTSIESLTFGFVKDYIWGENDHDFAIDVDSVANNLPYFEAGLSDVADLGNPHNIRYLDITFTQNGGEKQTKRIYSKNLRYVAVGNNTYHIQSTNDDISIVAFYYEAGAELTTWSLYDVRFVDTGTALGSENMPADPTYGDGNTYIFTNWDKNVGGGDPFLPYEIVADDTVVYAKKTSSQSGGTEIHVMNTDNTLINRVLELYNATNEDTLNTIDYDTVKIRVNGKDGKHTNENYYSNDWKIHGSDSYYNVKNFNTEYAVGNTQNTHIPHNEISSITVYFTVNDQQKEVTINEGTLPGQVSASLLGTENIIQILVNDAPSKPTEDELTGDPDTPDDTGLLGIDAVKVTCANDAATHQPKEQTYGLLDGYTLSDVQWTGNGETGYYYVDITVPANEYVNAFSTDTQTSHTLAKGETDTDTIRLQYANEGWKVMENETPVTFKVACTTEPGGGPEAPDLSGVKIQVACTNVEHPASSSYSLIDGSYNESMSENGDVYTVTVSAEEYVSQFSEDTGKTHRIDEVDEELPSDTLTIVYTYDGESWQTSGKGNTFFVTCAEGGEEQPTPPTPEEVIALMGDNAIEVACKTEGSRHNPSSYRLIPGSFDVGEVTKGEDGKYSCVITIDEDGILQYVDAYDEVVGSEHTAISFGPITFTITHDGTKWLQPEVPVETITVVCEADQEDELDEGDLNEILGGAITVQCVSEEDHGYKTLPMDELLENAYSFTKNENGTYTVTLDGEKYASAYGTYVSDKIGKGENIPHQLVNEENADFEIRLTYDGIKWTFDPDPIVIEVTCEDDSGDEPTPTPTPNPGPDPDPDPDPDPIPTPTPDPGDDDNPPYIPPVDPDDSGVSDLLNTDDHIQYLFGYPEGTFGPENNMTRAEVAQMFYNLLLDQDVTITKTFDDVPANAWYAKAVNTLASLGVVSGVGNGDFEPERSITRAEFTSIAMKFAEGKTGGTNIFSDVKPTDWFYRAVVNSTQYGWIHGYGDGTFRPNNPITRVEVTAIVNNMLGREADVDFVTEHYDELNHFSDLAVSHWGYYHIVEATNDHDYTKPSSGENWTELN